MKPADWFVILRHLTLVAGVGLAFVVPVLLGWQLGSWLVARVRWQGCFYGGIVLGVLSGCYSAFTLLKKTIPWE